MLQKRPVTRAENTSKQELSRAYAYNTIQLGIANRNLEAVKQILDEIKAYYGIEVYGGTIGKESK